MKAMLPLILLASFATSQANWLPQSPAMSPVEREVLRSATRSPASSASEVIAVHTRVAGIAFLTAAVPASAQERPPFGACSVKAQYAIERGPLQDHAGYLATLHELYSATVPEFTVFLPASAAARHEEIYDPPYLLAAKWDTERRMLEIAFRGGVEPLVAEDPDAFADWIDASMRPDARQRLRDMHKLRAYVTYYLEDGPALPNATRLLVEYFPRGGFAHGWRYLDTLWNRGDVRLANDEARAALATLSGHSWPLVVFSDLVLRGDPHDRKLAEQVAGALQPLLADWPDSPRLQIVNLRARLRATPERVTASLVEVLLDVVIDDNRALLQFVETVAGAPDARRFEQTIRNALRTAINRGHLHSLDLAAARYKVARALGDDDEAEKAFADVVSHAEGVYGCNSIAWRLLVDRDTMGRYDQLALAVMQHAERTAGRALSDAASDTMALALYNNGRFDDAIEYATSAIENGDSDVRYEMRRLRYERMRDRLRERR
jgi:hypothetical protein